MRRRTALPVGKAVSSLVLLLELVFIRDISGPAYVAPQVLVDVNHGALVLAIV